MRLREAMRLNPNNLIRFVPAEGSGGKTGNANGETPRFYPIFKPLADVQAGGFLRGILIQKGAENP